MSPPGGEPVRRADLRNSQDSRVLTHVSSLRAELTGTGRAVTAVASLALSACHGSLTQPSEVRRAATPAVATIPAAPVVQRMRRLLMLANPSTYSGPTSLAELEAERRTMTGADAPLGDKALAVLREVSPVLGNSSEPEAHEHLVTAFRLYVELLRLVARRYPEDLPTLHTVVATMSMLPYVADNLELRPEFEPALLRQQALALARVIARQFPRDAEAWGEVGDAARAVDDVEAMRAYKACAALDRTIERCEARLQELRDDYVRPYCDAGRIRAELAWRAGADRPAPELSPVTPSAALPEPLYVLPAARFDAHDVQQTKLRAEAPNPALTLSLRPEARAPFQVWLRDLGAQDRFAVLMVDDVPIARGPRGGFAHTGESWMLSNVALADVCASTVHQTLPADLGMAAP